VGDPEQHQAWNNASKFTVLFVATQRSLKNTEDEWVSKVEWHRVAVMWNQGKCTVLAVCEKFE
jgi:single-stranded DNA-binding protein